MDLSVLLHLVDHIAADVWPNGATLSCSVCGRIEEASTEDCARYLHSGWPKCCGKSMHCESRISPAAV